MTRTNFTKKERVIYLLDNHKHMTPAEVADMVGCSLSYAHRVRKEHETNQVLAAIKATGDIIEERTTPGASYTANSEFAERERAETRKYRKRVAVFVVVVLALVALFVVV